MTRETRAGWVYPSQTVEVAMLLPVQPESLLSLFDKQLQCVVLLALTGSSYGEQGRAGPASEETIDTLRAQAESIRITAGSAR